LGTGDLLALGDDLLLGNDINLSSDDLGLDLQGLEETCLSWIKTSWAWWDCHITWSDHTGLSWRWSNFLIKNGLDFAEISVGNDQVGVSGQLGEDLVDVGVVLPGILSFLIVFIALRRLFVGGI